jgi:hypothetical protein
MEVFVVFDENALGKDFIDDIDVVSSANSVKRLSKLNKWAKEPKRTDIIVEITTHDKLPELLKTIDPNNSDNDVSDDEDDADDDISDSSSNDDDTVQLPVEVYLVTPYEEDESDHDIDYSREIEVFIDHVDAQVYAETRKRDPLFKDILMAIVKKKIFRDSEVKKIYEQTKANNALKEVEVKKKKSSSSSASASASSATASTTIKVPKEPKEPKVPKEPKSQKEPKPTPKKQ